MINFKKTNEEIIDAIKSSKSRKETLSKLGLNNKGGSSYRFLEIKINELKIDTSHFISRFAWHKGKKLGRKHPIIDYFIGKRFISSNKFKKRLIEDNVKQRECESCHLKTWQAKVIPLELHHMDGNKFNNNLENLQLLCPNCHSFTTTYRGKNTKRAKLKFT